MPLINSFVVEVQIELNTIEFSVNIYNEIMVIIKAVEDDRMWSNGWVFYQKYARLISIEQLNCKSLKILFNFVSLSINSSTKGPGIGIKDLAS